MLLLLCRKLEKYPSADGLKKIKKNPGSFSEVLAMVATDSS